MSEEQQLNHQIFKYFNGIAQVCGDPLEIEEGLHFHLNGDPNGTVDLMNSEDPTVAYPATKEASRGYSTRSSSRWFLMIKATDTGAKWQDCLNTWNAFIAYKRLLKKSTEPLPTLPVDIWRML